MTTITRSWPKAAWLLAAVVLPVFFGGCRKSSTASGTVTFDGRNLDKGFITFFPVDDPGPTRGGEIVNGKYEVSNLTPGKKRVHISARPRAQIEPAEGGDGRRVQFLPPDLPNDASGNDQVIEISGGNQTLDFHLQKPTTSAGN
jgi:hypothetical protein